MKRKILFSIGWTVVFPVGYLFLSTLMFCVLGNLGIGNGPDPQPLNMTPGKWAVAILMMGWAVFFYASPLIGLALSIWGVLPGTRRKKELEPAV